MRIKSKLSFPYFFIIILFSVSTHMLSMEQEDQSRIIAIERNVRKYTYVINHNFLSAHKSMMNNDVQQARVYVDCSAQAMKSLEETVQQFYKSKQSKIETMLKFIAPNVPDNIRKFIDTTMIPTMTNDDTSEIHELIQNISKNFHDIYDKLVGALKNDDDNLLREHFISAIDSYNSFFLLFDKPQEQSVCTQSNVTDIVIKRIIDMLSYVSDHCSRIIPNAQEQQRHAHLETIRNIRQELLHVLYGTKDATPSKPTLISSILPTISNITGKIASLPMQQKIFSWIVKKDNTILDRLILLLCDAETYNKIKSCYFPIIEELNKRGLVRDLSMYINQFLENPVIRTILDTATELKDEQELVKYYNKLQYIHCAELLEKLKSCHVQSLKTVMRLDPHLHLPTIKSSNIKQCDNDIDNNIYTYQTIFNKQAEIQKLDALVNKEKEMQQQLQAQHLANPERTLVLYQGQEDSSQPVSLETVKTTFDLCASFVFSFITSLAPWHQVPNQSKEMETCDIASQSKTDLLLSNPVELQQEIQEIRQSIHDHITTEHALLQERIKIHKQLEEDHRLFYERYITGNNMSDIKTWDELPAAIDSLYEQLLQLKRERDALYWFNFWAKKQKNNDIFCVNQRLQHYIATYNASKIEVYRNAENLTKNKQCIMSQEQARQIFELSSQKKYEDYRYVFNTCERDALARLCKALHSQSLRSYF